MRIEDRHFSRTDPFTDPFIMRLKHSSILSILVFSLGMTARGQDNFQNLNFESANIPTSTPVNSYVPISEALPNWSAYFSTGDVTQPQTQVGYDSISLGGDVIAVTDKNAPIFTPLQGKYSALLSGGVGIGGDLLYSASISQTGLVPGGTQSLLFDASVYGASFNVTLGGQTINMIPLKTLANYTEYGGEIPFSFAGQSETLTFTEPPVSNGEQPSFLELDKIVFSQTAVPEPSIVALGAMGGLLFGARKWLARRG